MSKMSIIQTHLMLLLIACLVLCSWALPKPAPGKVPTFSNYNEVTSQEDEDIHNDILRQLAALRAITTESSYQKKRRAQFAAGTHPNERSSYSRFLGRVFTQPSFKYTEDAAVPPGGANYYSNYVPLSTYEISEPETVYY